MTALFIAMCQASENSSLGFLALPAVTNVAAILLVIVLYFSLEKQVGTLDRSGIASTLGKSLLGSIVMGGIAFAAFRFVPLTLHKIPMLLAFLFIFCAVGWVYFYVTRSLKMPETEYLDRAFARLNRRKQG
jgi:peptidoglycan biosynthesis protein MviN/MurJ (putative lipid II flippase)